MGSMIEINDTLQLTADQGWPAELDLATHLQAAYTLKDVEGKIFEFKDKPAIRVYKQPPVRNFLAENINGKWVYWGKCFIVEITHDYEKQTTSGKFRIVELNSPDEMKQAFKYLDLRPEFNYFA
jgi:hypothetical protein